MAPKKISTFLVVLLSVFSSFAQEKFTLSGTIIDAADAATDAIGILLHTVDPAVNPNGALLIQGVIDVDKAKLSGFTYSANDIAALKKAVPAVFCRTDVGAKRE